MFSFFVLYTYLRTLLRLDLQNRKIPHVPPCSLFRDYTATFILTNNHHFSNRVVGNFSKLTTECLAFWPLNGPFLFYSSSSSTTNTSLRLISLFLRPINICREYLSVTSLACPESRAKSIRLLRPSNVQIDRGPLTNGHWVRSCFVYCLNNSSGQKNFDCQY